MKKITRENAEQNMLFRGIKTVYLLSVLAIFLITIFTLNDLHSSGNPSSSVSINCSFSFEIVLPSLIHLNKSSIHWLYEDMDPGLGFQGILFCIFVSK